MGEGSESMFLANPDKFSHQIYFRDRNWKRVEHFWNSLIKTQILPDWVLGDSTYGVANLEAVKNCAHEELKNPRNQRKTFAIRIGYAGTAYKGYQSQGGKSKGVIAVEDDVREAVGRSIVGAGRTDKGVAAVSQVVSFHTTSMTVTEESIMSTLRTHPAFICGKLAAFDVKQVPRKFHAMFSATWRRYLYLFPLNTSDWARELLPIYDDEPVPERVHYFPVSRTGSDLSGSTGTFADEALEDVDVDVSFINEMLQRLQGKALNYNGFAYKEWRPDEGSCNDTCTLYLARAFLVDTTVSADIVQSLPPSAGTCGDGDTEKAADVVGDRDVTTKVGSSKYSLCIELVGDRFLRRMVRNIVSTAVRESQLSLTERDADVLLKITAGRSRDRTASVVPGTGLSMCGVGYNLEDLSVAKYAATNPKTIARNKRRREKEMSAIDVGGKLPDPSSVIVDSAYEIDRSECEGGQDGMHRYPESIAPSSRSP